MCTATISEWQIIVAIIHSRVDTFTKGLFAWLWLLSGATKAETGSKISSVVNQ